MSERSRGKTGEHTMGKGTVTVDARRTRHCLDWLAYFLRLIAHCIDGFIANTAI